MYSHPLFNKEFKIGNIDAPAEIWIKFYLVFILNIISTASPAEEKKSLILARNFDDDDKGEYDNDKIDSADQPEAEEDMLESDSTDLGDEYDSAVEPLYERQSMMLF